MAFDAFISYSHKDDTRVAKALQDNLHRLAKKWDSLSAIRVFRDVTHLPVTALTPALLKALSDSQFLILLASPQAADSKWVNAELAHFLETRPPEQVLVVLLEGTLDWDDQSGDFVRGPACAFPELDRKVFDKEPLFVDLRWASGEVNLTLTNPRVLDAVATLAATLQGVPKETLVGDLVEEHRRLRRNQRLNLGFRGAFGFGLAAASLFLSGTVYSFTSGASLSAESTSQLYFAVGFPVVGAIGALCCGAGWRGIAGFAAGFGLLLPFYLMSIVSPIQPTPVDTLVLAMICVAGFAAAGGLGAAATPLIRWRDGARAFATGGAAAACLSLFLSADGIRTRLIAWPWPLGRFWLQSRRAASLAANVFDDRSTTVLIPFVVGVALGGLLLGRRLADAQTRTDHDGNRKPGRVSRLFGRLLQWRVAAVVMICVGLYLADSLRASRQYALASDALDSDMFRPLLTRTGDNMDRTVRARALPMALRARNALERRGDRTKAEQLSNLIEEAVQLFAQNPSEYHERYKNSSFKPLDLGEVAQVLKEAGRPSELAHLLDAIRERRAGADALETIAIARAEAVAGSKDAALITLRGVEHKLKGERWFIDLYERTLLAQTLFDLNEAGSARTVLEKAIRDVSVAVAADSVALLGLRDRWAVESGDVLWRTGLWQQLPKWREELSDVLAEGVEGMCKRGELEPAVTSIRENQRSTAFWHTQARFSGAAAHAQHFETAFAVLDAFESGDDPGWTYFSDRAEGLSEIITAAVASGNRRAVEKAADGLRNVEQAVRRRSELTSSIGATLASAYIRAGRYEAAIKVSSDVSDDPWSVDSAVGLALTERNDRDAASQALARAWRGLQAGDRSGDHIGILSAIGSALARIDRPQAAFSVADDLGSNFAYYSGGLDELQKLDILVTILENEREH